MPTAEQVWVDLEKNPGVVQKICARCIRRRSDKICEDNKPAGRKPTSSPELCRLIGKSRWWFGSPNIGLKQVCHAAALLKVSPSDLLPGRRELLSSFLYEQYGMNRRESEPLLLELLQEIATTKNWDDQE